MQRFDTSSLMQGRAALFYKGTRRGQLVAELEAKGIYRGSREFAAALWASEPEEYRTRKRERALAQGLAFDAYTGTAYALAIETRQGDTMTARLHCDPAITRAAARNGGDKERQAAERAGVPWQAEGVAWERWREGWARNLRTNPPAPKATPRPARLPYREDD